MVATIILILSLLFALVSFTVAFIYKFTNYYDQDDDEQESINKSKYKDKARINSRGEQSNNKSSFLSGMFFMAVFLILAYGSMVVEVPEQTVGIVNTTEQDENKEIIDNGKHVKTPWEKVDYLDISEQTSIFNGDKKSIACLADDFVVSVESNIKWQVKKDDSAHLHKEYKNIGEIRKKLVEKEYQEIVKDNLSVLTEKEVSDKTKEEISKEIKDTMTKELPSISTNNVNVKKIEIKAINEGKENCPS